MPQPSNVEDVIQEFLLACETDGLSAETIKWYRSILKAVAACFQGTAIEQITTASLRNYLGNMNASTTRYEGQPRERQGKLSTETIKGRMRALRRFFKWCQQQGYVGKNPMADIRAPRRSYPDPKATSEDNLRRLLEATAQSVMGRRDRAMIMFMADTGCRAGGLLGLEMDKLDLAQRRAIVREKGDKARPVFFGPLTAEFLGDWLAVRPANATRVFCSLKEHVRGKPMSVSGLNQMLKRLKRKAGIQGRCNPHSIRHWFAIHYLEKGGNLSTLRRLLGHSDVKVTDDYYAVFDNRDLARSHALFSPVNDWGGAPRSMIETDAQRLMQILLWLVERFPGQPVALVGDGHGIKVGVMSLPADPAAADWCLKPATLDQFRANELLLPVK